MVAALFGIAFLLLAFATRGYREVEAMQSLEKAAAAVRRDFPEARPVSSEKLAAWLGEPLGVTLIDVREAEEFAVSRLPGAQRATDMGDFPNLADARVVVYDSVGFRSAEYVRVLRDRGSAHAFYLEGGIFQWANEGRPLVDAEENPTTKVHPFNKLWGRLLDKGRK